MLNETGSAEIVKVQEVEEVQKVQEVQEVEKVQEVEEVQKAEEVDKVEVVQEIESGKIEAPVLVLTEPETAVNPSPVPVEAVNPANDLVFEPYHMVDYFASQGIRFKEEEKPTDEFGKQLKSFTDWLKTLKRLPVTELAKNVNPQAEQKVEQMAGQSITDREVLTEAMAEVWEKQGNTLKAIDIYSKLSLLEPAKSPYFAAKIEGLKKKN